MSDSENLNEEEHHEEENQDIIHDIVPVSGMYKDWFLEYASYVILERAVPAIEDGLKPVQRRILHSMKEMDDGRYNKVANVIGHTMQYHPHGDASIGDAMVNLGQKDLLIDTQGNWGDIRTGDGAAAPRYIEARLTKLAHTIVFNPQTTAWQASYDGRKKEPITLPVKFPLLLNQGVEGIAVGLATKIMPHNFIELCKGAIKVLEGKKTNILPDFATGGIADFSDYNDGLRGGKIKVRAKIDTLDKKTLIIKEIPFGTTTSSVIDSVIKANDNGKIKIKKIVDNTAKELEIEISLAPGISPDIMIDALYAFTDCEVSISPNACVIVDEKPVFMGVNGILAKSTENTKELLRQELEIRKAELMEKILFTSLEKIFIENRIYRDIEEVSESFEEVINTVDRGLEPYKPDFYREITRDDLLRLLEIRIKRISKFDSFKADELMKGMQDELAEVEHHLAHLVEYAIAYYEGLIKNFGKGKERKTEISQFETIKAAQVAVNNAKLYANIKEGFIGTSLKKDDFICDCSDIDDVIVFRRDGKFIVTKLQDKVFVGKNIIHVAIFKKGDERMTYNMVYHDGETGLPYIKRFNIKGVTRDKEYDLTKGTKRSKVLHFTANANGEAEVITAYLTSSSPAKKKVFDFDFADLAIKGRGAGGNRLSKYNIRKIVQKSQGVSTLGGLKIYFDEVLGKLNTEERGEFIGEFNGNDNVLVIHSDGNYELTTYELTNRYDAKKINIITKFDPEKIISAVYYDGKSKLYYVKRFKIETSTIGKKFPFISEAPNSRLNVVSINKDPKIDVDYRKSAKGEKLHAIYSLMALIEVKGWKAMGNRLTADKVVKVSLVPPTKEELAAEKEEELEKKSKKVETEKETSTKDTFQAGDSVDLSSPDDQMKLF